MATGLPMPVNFPLIVRAILDEHALSSDGDHGVAHWARVLENGLRLAMLTGANIEVVQLSAQFLRQRTEIGVMPFNEGIEGNIRLAERAQPCTRRGRFFLSNDPLHLAQP